MRTHRALQLLLGSLFIAATACSAGGSSSTSTSTTAGSGGGSTTTSGTGGAGTGGSTTTAGTGGSTTTGTGGSGTGGSGTGGGAGTPGDHLLISEIGVAPAGGEFVEITNPTADTIDLGKYYLSDNSAYYGIAAGQAWNPVTSNPGTDFLAQFPAGTTLAPGASIVIATDPTFEMLYGKCPDFILAAAPLTCASGTAKAMVAPANGGIGDKKGALISNDREMIVLFSWDGSSPTIEDVDYVTWGVMFEDATRVDKTGVAGYASDTARASQSSAPAPTAGQSIERCGASPEPGEKTSGGNGLTGHDETSEALNQSFKVQTLPTPGAKNSCM
ncbi:MAG: lamin tail domain-containing protein [Byssovorax sp.]